VSQPLKIIVSSSDLPCRSPLYFVLSSIFGGKEEPRRLMVNFLKDYLVKREQMEEKPVGILLIVLPRIIIDQGQPS